MVPPSGGPALFRSAIGRPSWAPWTAVVTGGRFHMRPTTTLLPFSQYGSRRAVGCDEVCPVIGRLGQVERVAQPANSTVVKGNFFSTRFAPSKDHPSAIVRVEGHVLGG